MDSHRSESQGAPSSPKEKFITVYGRKPVLEALEDHDLAVDKLLLAEGAAGSSVQRLMRLAAGRGIPVHRASAQRVKVLAGNGRHDQGVLADVLAPRMRRLEDYLAELDPAAAANVVLLDGITTPGNLGMILRTAVAAGIDGVVLPRKGVAGIDPMVVKASAGLAFSAPVLHCASAAPAAAQLASAGFGVYGMDSQAPESVFTAHLPHRLVVALGAESEGLSAALREQLTGSVHIPLATGVDSLNVASAAAVVCFELVRRSLA